MRTGAGNADWLRLAVAGAATLLVGMGIGRFSYTPLAPALIDAGSLTAAQAGLVGAFNLAGYLVGALATPRLRRRLGEIATLKSCLWVSLSCLVASIPDLGFAWLAFWRFLVGVAVAVTMILTLAIVTRAAPADRLGRAAGIVYSGVGIAILLSGTIVPPALETGLAAAWGVLAAAGTVGVLVALWGWAGPVPPLAGSPASARPPLSPAVLRLIAAHGLFAIGLVPHTIYWVDYLARGLGKGIETGGLHWVLVGMGAVCGAFLHGWLADRIGFARGLVLAFTLLAVGIAVPVLETAPAALVASSLIFGAQPGFTAILSGRAHQVVGASHMPGVWRRMILVSGICQAAAGYGFVALFDWTGSYTPVFLAGGAAMALGAVVSIELRSGARCRV